MSGRRPHDPMLPLASARLLPWVQYGERGGKWVISAHGINADHLTSSLAGGVAVPTSSTLAPAPIANHAAEPRAHFTIWLLLMEGVQCCSRGENSHMLPTTVSSQLGWMALQLTPDASAGCQPSVWGLAQPG